MSLMVPSQKSLVSGYKGIYCRGTSEQMPIEREQNQATIRHPEKCNSNGVSLSDRYWPVIVYLLGGEQLLIEASLIIDQQYFPPLSIGTVHFCF